MPSRKLKNLESILRTVILKPPKDFNERMVPYKLKAKTGQSNIDKVEKTE